MRHCADATLDPALHRPETLLYHAKKNKNKKLGVVITVHSAYAHADGQNGQEGAHLPHAV